MKKYRFRVPCIILSVAGAVCGVFLPLIGIDVMLFQGSISVFQLLVGMNTLFSLGEMFPLTFLLLIPAALGILTAIFCIMKSRPIKTFFSLLSFLSMAIMVPAIKFFAVEAVGSLGSGYGELGGLFGSAASSVVNSMVTIGAGYWLYLVCFLAVFILNLMSVNQKRHSSQQGIPCPQCGVANPPQAQRCFRCGTSLAQTATASAAATDGTDGTAIPPQDQYNDGYTQAAAEDSTENVEADAQGPRDSLHDFRERIAQRGQTVSQSVKVHMEREQRQAMRLENLSFSQLCDGLCRKLFSLPLVKQLMPFVEYLLWAGAVLCLLLPIILHQKAPDVYLQSLVWSPILLPLCILAFVKRKYGAVASALSVQAFQAFFYLSAFEQKVWLMLLAIIGAVAWVTLDVLVLSKWIRGDGPRHAS